MAIDKQPPDSDNPEALEAGADNLLLNCLNLKEGQSLLLVLEPDESLYRKIVGEVVERRAKFHGATIQVVTEAVITTPHEFPESISTPMQTADHTLFFSRVGDYVRFVELPGKGTKTSGYALDAEMLGSPYATLDHHLMTTLRDKLEQELMSAGKWRVRCPLGTDLSGTFNWPSLSGSTDDELLITLFPVSTFKPIPCGTATGRVALSRWLMPGAAAKLENAHLNLSKPVFCDVENGEICGFSGVADVTNQVSAHYDYVANTLNINRNRVHSWHVGINPQTFFKQDVDTHLDSWSAISFGSPRYLHFHTCGDEPPGEIAWSVFDPTVIIDDQVYWANGQFMWLQRSDNKQLILETPGASVLLSGSLGIGV